MPIISVFFGIVIRINFRDHAPPHLHAAYGDLEALFDLRSGRVITGRLPRRETRYVLEWLVRHRPQLLENWDLAVAGRPTFRIPGLEDDE